MQINHVHCFFEQSGTFKNAFKKNNILAFDYDLKNEYNQTDYIIDLFLEIEKAYNNEESIFDNIQTTDLIFAFFPCIYFCENNQLQFCGNSINYIKKTKIEINQIILQRNEKRALYYNFLLKLFTICEIKNYKLIVENPYSSNHYLYNNFPYKPQLIDFNRNKKGDYFRKPTQYFFLNCLPETNYNSFCKQKLKKIQSCTGHVGTGCNKERSEISPEYAENFISDYILSEKTKHTVLNLFNYNC